MEGRTDNRVVLRWCHRSVAVVASRRYRREIDDIKAAHHDISSLFLETWLNGKLPPPPTTTMRAAATMSPLGDVVGGTRRSAGLGVGFTERTASLAVVSPLSADRHISAQPLLLSDTAYNLRRLSELWYQLLNAGKLLSPHDSLNKLTTFSFLELFNFFISLYMSQLLRLLLSNLLNGLQLVSG